MTRWSEGVKIKGSVANGGGFADERGRGAAGETAGAAIEWVRERVSRRLVLTTRVLGVRGEEMAPSGPAEATRPLVEGPVWV